MVIFLILIPLKACSSNTKYSITIQTRPTQIVNSIEKLVFIGLLKIIGIQNQPPITFCLDLQILPPHTRISNLQYLITHNPNIK